MKPGDSAVLQASVNADQPFPGKVSGSVTFFDEAKVLGTSKLVDGVATFPTAPLSAGTHPFKAVFNGHGIFAPSTSTTLDPTLNPTVSISNVSQNEGTSGTTAFMFMVSLSDSSTETITVDYATANGTATTADGDYSAASGTLTFNPGDMSKFVTVNVNGDTKYEPNETFTVGLANATHATISTAQGTGTGTIQNDDFQPNISIANVSHAEGNSGTTAFTFSVTLGNASYQTITVAYATANGTATTADGDYTAASGTLTFNPGETSKTITVNVTGDTKYETDETFTVNLSNATNAMIMMSQATGTIQNDDSQPTLSIGNVSQNEGNSGTTGFAFTVTLSAASSQTVTVNYATTDGTATTIDSDYTAASGMLTFNPGETSKTITINVTGDIKYESDETFTVNLSGAMNATIVTGQGTGTILNDDMPPSLSINSLSQSESSGSFMFTVTLSAAMGTTVTVAYATANGTATTADGDYTATSGTLTFNPGVTTQTIMVMVTNDTKYEANETFTVNLSNATGATIATSQGTGTILNDDSAPSLSMMMSNVSHSEGNSGTTSFTFDVTLSAVSGLTTTVDYATANGTATTADGDYSAASGTLTFNPGETSKSITVYVTGDTKYEPDETFTVNLSNATNATIATTQGTGTIQNDDVQPNLSIGNVTQAEGDSGTTSFTFTVTLSAVSGVAATVNYATANGTATTADGDYTAASGTLTFNPGETSKTITVNVTGDTKYETDETFTVNLSNATNAMIMMSQATGTIQNDDSQPTLSIGNVSQNEGNSSTTGFAFTVTLSAASSQTVTVNYATTDGTATTIDSDYTAASGMLTFNPGETSKTITINVNGDTKYEPDETFAVNLSGAMNATIATGQGIGTILNDDSAPSLSINSLSQSEGSGSFTFTVTLSAASGVTTTVAYATANGTATTADGDYTATSGTLTFNPGVTTQTIMVMVTNDTKYEADETFTVNLSNATNATIATSQGTGTILNDDSAPSLSMMMLNVSHPEGNSGTTSFTFDVTLSAASGMTTTVDYATANGTATTADGDYTAASGTLTFNPGETSKSITVYVTGDTKYEPDETFTVNLSNVTNATIMTSQATGTIQNDDSQPTLSIGNVSQNEGNSGTTSFTFTVTLSAVSGVAATVNYATADGMASGAATTADGDYTAASGTLTFNPGETSKTITVNVNGDTKYEPDETFAVNLSGAMNATIATGQGTGTILNDDDPPSLSINSLSQSEGSGSFTFTVTLSAASGVTTTVAYATANGTATTADGDYMATSGTLTFNPGVTTQTITVMVTNDTKYEADETFTVNLANATGATIATSQGTGTILNDDSAPSLSMLMTNVSRPEGNSGTTSFTFDVTLSAASGMTTTVDYATADGTATTADGDYTAASGTLTFNPGQISKSITVYVTGDTRYEADETFTVTLSNPTNATIASGQGTATGTIQNDDMQPSLSIGNVSQNEGNSGTTNFTFTVTLSAVSGVAATVSYATSDGTATTANSDYTAASGTLTFNPGETSKTFTVNVTGDTTYELNETFTVTLSNATNAMIIMPMALGTIVNDDAPPNISFAVSTMTVGEGDAVAEATVNIDPQLALPAEFFVSVIGGTAVEGTEYTSHVGHFFPIAGTSSLVIPLLHPIDDPFYQPNHTVVLQLMAISGVAVSSPSTITVTILDNDTNNLPTNPDGPAVVTPDLIQAGQDQVSESAFDVSSASGALTATHSLPSYQADIPPLTLTYNSLAADPRPILLVHYTLDPNQAVPSQVSAQLTLDGTAYQEFFYDTSSLSPGAKLQFALQADATGLATGRYDYQVDVTAHYGTPSTTTYTGQVTVINEQNSPFGAGWALSGVDRLFPVTGGAILELAGGLSLWFADGQSSGTFIAPAGDFSTLVENNDGTFTRTLKDGTQTQFDADGLQTSVVDRNSNTFTFAYTSGLLTSITDPNGLETDLTYTSGLLTSITDPAGRTSAFTIDTSGNLTEITDPDPDGNGPLAAPACQLAYDSAHRLTDYTDPNDHTTSFGYNFAGRVDGVTRPDTSTEAFTAVQMRGLVANGSGTTTSPADPVLRSDVHATYTDGRSHDWQTQVDNFGFGLATQTVDPLGDTTVMVRDGNGLVTSYINPLGLITGYEYDAYGNLTVTTLPDSTLSYQFQYHYTYNSFGEVTSITNPADPNETASVYQFVYDAHGNLTERILPDDDTNPNNNPTWVYTYNSHGWVTSQADPMGFTTSFSYNDRGELTQITYPDDDSDPDNNPTVTFTYDDAGNVTSTTNERGFTTSFIFDNLNRLIQITHPDDDSNPDNNPQDHLAYDANSNLTSTTDPLGHTTSFSYDAISRLASMTGPDPDGTGPQSAAVTVYAYDANGNRTSVTDPINRVTVSVYDEANRMIETGIGTSLTDYEYDAAGQVTSITYPDPDPGRPKTTFKHNARGEVTQKSSNSGGQEKILWCGCGCIDAIY